MNRLKSEVMPVSKVCHPAAVSAFQFKWIPSGMKYLGIRLCADMNNIIQLNMSPLLQKRKNDLDKWTSINLTLWRKMYIIKMVVAPQFNYTSSDDTSDNLYRNFQAV